MAKCKICKVNIPDGTEYCSNCQDKGKEKADESYLDSLLNSVKNSVPASEAFYNKKSDSQELPPKKTIPAHDMQQEQTAEDLADYDIDLSDIEDFDQLYKEENDISIGDEELFGESLSDLFKDSEADNEPVSNPASADRNEKPDNISEPSHEDIEEARSDFPDKEEDEPVQSLSKQNASEEITDEQTDEGELDPDINELLQSLDMQDDADSSGNEAVSITDADISDDKLSNEPAAVSDITVKNDEEPANASGTIEEVTENDDIINLLNQISPDDPVSADVMAINDLLSGRPVQKSPKSDKPSNVGEVFSDALKVVSSLNDPDAIEEDLLDSIPSKAEGKKEKKKRQKKTSKKKTDISEEATPNKPKEGLLKRIFGNVPDENAAKVKDKFATEEKDAEKTARKAKGKKKKQPIEEKDEEQIGSGRGRASVGKAEDAKEKKKDKKEKKKKTKEIIQVIDEIEEDEGRINRLGASIVFVFFGLLVLLLLVGTNVVSYSISIQHANNYFEKQKYNEAYNEVYGIDIKDEDIVIYDKIMTVMFVNKQLNSYNNYYSLKMYPEALDALLKGLSRYDKYIELATMLGIETDLNYVRSQILAELKTVFHLSEEKAMQIIATEDTEEYSSMVYNVVQKNMNY